MMISQRLIETAHRYSDKAYIRTGEGALTAVVDAELIPACSRSCRACPTCNGYSSGARYHPDSS
jgi:hypothetical protein